MLNNQKLSYKIFLESIPVSKNLKKLLNLKNLSKIKYISNGDDYQILFTASKNMSGIIKRISQKNGIKLTKIGIIQSSNKKSSIVNGKNQVISLKNKGYFHKF
jgi:thiamine-monophosphate kinase